MCCFVKTLCKRSCRETAPFFDYVFYEQHVNFLITPKRMSFEERRKLYVEELNNNWIDVLIKQLLYRLVISQNIFQD